MKLGEIYSTFGLCAALALPRCSGTASMSSPNEPSSTLICAPVETGENLQVQLEVEEYALRTGNIPFIEEIIRTYYAIGRSDLAEDLYKRMEERYSHPAEGVRVVPSVTENNIPIPKTPLGVPLPAPDSVEAYLQDEVVVVYKPAPQRSKDGSSVSGYIRKENIGKLVLVGNVTDGNGAFELPINYVCKKWKNKKVPFAQNIGRKAKMELEDVTEFEYRFLVSYSYLNERSDQEIAREVLLRVRRDISGLDCTNSEIVTPEGVSSLAEQFNALRQR